MSRIYLIPPELELIRKEAKLMGEKYSLFIDLFLVSHRRISELLKITPMDIDTFNNYITWNILKKRKPYKAVKPATNELILRLKSYVETRGIVHDKRIFPYTRFWANWLFKKIGKKVGLGWIHPHTFRHTYTVLCILHNINPALIKKSAEWSNWTSFDSYSRLVPEDLRDASEKMKKLIN